MVVIVAEYSVGIEARKYAFCRKCLLLVRQPLISEREHR